MIREKIKDLLNKIDAVRMIYYHDYCPSNSRDGGCYSFEDYFEKDGDSWIVEHYTSCEGFAYCPVFGTWQDCARCWYWDYDEEKEGFRCFADYKRISTERLANEIFENYFDPQTSIYFEIGKEEILLKSADYHHFKTDYCTRCGFEMEPIEERTIEDLERDLENVKRNLS